MTISASAGAKALAYAEQTLGVHVVYEDAGLHGDALKVALGRLAEKRAERRTLEEQIETRTLELTSDEWARHEKMSVAAMDRHLKIELPKDAVLASLKGKLSERVSEIESLEYDVKGLETDIRIAVARMNELGGYFTYLAAIKQAEQAKKSENTENTQ